MSSVSRSFFSPDGEMHAVRPEMDVVAVSQKSRRRKASYPVQVFGSRRLALDASPAISAPRGAGNAFRKSLDAVQLQERQHSVAFLFQPQVPTIAPLCLWWKSATQLRAGTVSFLSE